MVVNPAPLLPSFSHLLSDGGADVGAGLEHHGVGAIGIAVEADLGDGLAQLGVRPLEEVVRAPQDVRRLKYEGQGIDWKVRN